MAKKTLGILFLLVGLLLTLSLLIQLPVLLGSLGKLFSAEVEPYENGVAIGFVFGYSLMVVAVFYLVKYGLWWTNGTRTSKEVLGWLFLLGAVIVILVFLAQLPALLASILLLRSRGADPFIIGVAISNFAIGAMQITSIFFLLKYGLRWRKKPTHPNIDSRV